MNFRSTRSDECVSPSYALLHGLAADGGLYVPESFPEKVLSYKELAGKSYQEIAEAVLSHFFTNFTAEERKQMISSAYNNKRKTIKQPSPATYSLRSVNLNQRPIPPHL